MTTTLIGSIPDVIPLIVSWTSNAIAVLCVIPYLLSIRRGVAQPPPSTWGIWTAAGLVGTGGMILAKASPYAWGLKLALTVGPAAVTMTARRKGLPWVASRTDRLCLGLAAVGLVFLLFGDGIPALVLAIIINIIGTPPTVRHAIREPYGPDGQKRESYFPFACAFVSVAAVLAAAVPWPWSFASVAYPFYLLVDVVIIMGAIAYGRRRARRIETVEVSA